MNYRGTRTNEGDAPAPRCENDAAPHVAASGVNGEDDNCGGDDVHGERELGRKAREAAGTADADGGAVAMVAAAERKNCWSGKKREERREDEQTVSFNYECIGGGRSVGRAVARRDRLFVPSDEGMTRRTH